MWAPDMDRRMYRAGQRPYNRGNFVPSTVSRQVDDRIHARGLSTSSNSSWTFSNSPADFPKQRQGGVCGAVLLAAVFVVVAAVLCVGGLAFYMGAKRVEPSNAYLVVDGSLRVTYGDQFREDLKDASSKLYLDKAQRYQHLITVVLQKTSLHSSLKEVTVLRFVNGTSLVVGFRLYLDRRKAPAGPEVQEIIRKALEEEFASVKPIAFRNMAVELQNLYVASNAAEENSFHESAHLEHGDVLTKSDVKSSVIRKTQNSTSPVSTKPKPVLTPVMGTSVKMAELGETIKLRNEAKVGEKTKSEVKSVEFNPRDEPKIEIVKEVVQEAVKKTEVQTSPEVTEQAQTTTVRPSTMKPSKVYQSIYITSDNVRITNVSNGEGSVGSYKVNKPDLVDYNTPSPKVGSGSYTITKTEPDVVITHGANFHKTPSSERVRPELRRTTSAPSTTTTTTTTSTTTTTTTTVSPPREIVNSGQIIRATTWAAVNGHARPLTPPPVNVAFALVDQDEPWRPIIPTNRPLVISTPKPYVEGFDSLIIDNNKELNSGEKIDAPITFSKRVYEENIKAPPEFSEKHKTIVKNTKLSKITEEIAKKYKDMLKHQGEPEETTVKNILSSTSTTVVPSITESTSTTVIVNPFKDEDNSRASSIVKFGLPELPIIQQFHHLDSLLKSFSGGTASGEIVSVTHPTVPEEITVPFVETTSTTKTSTSLTSTTMASTSSSTSTEKSTTVTTTMKSGETSRSPPPALSLPVTRFPARRRYTTVPSTDMRYIQVSTIAPDKRYKTDSILKTVIKISALDAATTSSTTDSIPTTSTTATSKAAITPSSPTTDSSLSSTAKESQEPFVVKGEVEVLDQTTAEGSITTEATKLVTLLPVRSNVNMKTPLRPRPPIRRGRYHDPPHRFVDDEGGKRWVYYSSSKMTRPPEKLFIVTPEPRAPEKITNLPILNTIEELLNTDHRDRSQDATRNTSEIIDRIVKIMDHIAITAENSTKAIVKYNSTLIKKPAHVVSEVPELKNENGNLGISTKAVFSGGVNYKLNQAGVPILTKVLKKDPSLPKKDLLNEKFSSHIHPTECGNNSVRCSNGVCLPPSTRCNQLVDCPDAADEKNCTCAEHLQAQRLTRKLCDGVVDCWDFSDEYNCEWCKPKQYLCTNSRTCIDQEMVCDGTAQCPHGDDERSCVTISPSAAAWGSEYHSSGYLMVRKHGQWGKLCIDNFDEVSEASQTGWQLSDLGRSVCKALTYKDFDRVERVHSVPNEGRSFSSGSSAKDDKFYELTFGSSPIPYGREASLTFQGSNCSAREVVKVTCKDLECGLRPQVSSQWSRHVNFNEGGFINHSRVSRIVGGGNASPGSWPWQAALYREGVYQCGGTVISSTWLISAGHCFYDNQDEWWVARLGTLRTSSSLPSPHEQIRHVAQVVVHPQYVDWEFINDIALLRLAEPVRFTDHVRPICLPPPTAIVKDGAICTVVGWGQLFEFGRVFPDTLQEVQVPVISSAECRKRTVFMPLYKITDDMFCAGYDRGGRDACLGDSGGPLMCQETDGRWRLYGIISNGSGCARSNLPGVYTKVAKYHSWIQARIFSEGNATGKDIVDKCKGHRCPLGECLPSSRLCNGFVECSDGSDEKDCW